MKKMFLKSIGVVAVTALGFVVNASAQTQVKAWQPAVATDTITGIKFSSLPKEKQDEMRKEFAENGITVDDDALIFYAKRKKDETSVLTEENGKLLQQSLPKGGVYLVPKRDGIKYIAPKGPQKIYITTP